MGGKKALRNIIYRLFPKDFGRYIEVFGGGGWVLFGRPPDCKGMEVYNDFNGNLTNLFYCVKNRTLAFLKELGFLPLNSRNEFGVLRRFFEKNEFDTEYLKEELELAQQNLPPPEYFKIATELSKLSHVVAYTHAVDEQALQSLHLKCVEEVKRINGAIDFEDAYNYQKRRT